MARTKQRTLVQDFVVTAGDEIHGDDTPTPVPVIVRGGEAPDGSVGASATFRAGDANVGGVAEFRAGDGALTSGGAALFRAGDGVTGGGPGELRAGNATTGPGGVATVSAGDGSVGGALSLSAGDGSSGAGGAVTLNAGDGVSVGGTVTLSAGDGATAGDVTLVSGTGAASGGNITLTAGDNTGTSGDGGTVTISGGAALNGAGLGDGGSLVLEPGRAAGSGSDGSIVIDYATWPPLDGSSGQVLSTDGAGTLSWIAAGGGGEDLAATLALGNTTGGNDVVLSAGDGIQFASSGGTLDDVSGDVTMTGGTTGRVVVKTEGVSPPFGRLLPPSALLLGTNDPAALGGLGGWVLVERAVTSRGSNVEVRGGAGDVATIADGGDVTVEGGPSNGTGDGGDLSLRAGSGTATGSGGLALIQGGGGGIPGECRVVGGSGIGAGAVGADVVITGGSGTATGAGGDVRIAGGFSLATLGVISLDGPIDRDAGAYKFGSISVSSDAGTATVTFATPFVSGPALTITATWVFPGVGAPSALPPTPPVVHSVGLSGFTVAWTPFEPITPITFEIHWTVRR